MKYHLNSSATATLHNALELAAETYRKDADEALEHPRVKAQFIRQAEQMEAFAAAIADHDELTVISTYDPA
jgi:hypothetical protein